ncbi:hypothetical protein [Vreelandella stevensii]|uniref:hypothetical protein n=1 Tax=Vreelandella stevensii TaxID=502821 RepID=UPI00403ADD45
MLDKDLEKALGLEFELSRIESDLQSFADKFASGPYTANKAQEPNMSQQDRYIDARLAGIESKLDARMEALQRFQEQAEARAERNARDAETRMTQAVKDAEDRMTQLYLKTDERMDALHADNKGLRVHLWAAVLTAVLGFAGVAALMQSTVSEQGAWLRQSIERIEQRVDSTPATSVTPESPPAQTEPPANPTPAVPPE